MELTIQNVDNVVLDCLDRTLKDNTVVCKGIVKDYGFNKEKLELHYDDICSMLEQLPEQFKEGANFLEAYERKDGTPWGCHVRMEALFCLGMGIGKVECLLPRELWDKVSFGVPYYRVN